MADETSRERLPIKLIMPKQGAERKVHGGGSPAKPFRAVTAEYRRSLTTQVSAVVTSRMNSVTTPKQAASQGQ